MTIDFGDGRRLERTLHGNIATWLCDSEGRAQDIIPGLITPSEFITRLDATGVSQAVVRRGAIDSTLEVDGAKTRVEAPLKEALRQLVPRATPGRTGPDRGKRLVEAPIENGLRSIPFGARPDLLKGAVESRIEGVFGPYRWGGSAAAHQPMSKGGRELAADSAYNRRVRDPRARRLLIQHPRMRPDSEATARLFRDVLHVDLDDPWLGLAPYVLGGELGRHGGEPKRSR